MTQSLTCGKCGAMLPADAPEEMCPKCLIVAGLMLQVGADEVVTMDMSPSAASPASQGGVALQSPPIPRHFGGYRIVRPLGKGGMGAVYEAEEEATGRRLAVKVLFHSLDSEQARTRFFREGRLAASVNHPNSVYVFGTEEIAGMPVITMELAPGGTLQDLIKRKGPLPITEAVDSTLQIIAGLESAAAGGVLHRDVKPSNCFIDVDGTVKVGDFGLSISTLARSDTNLTTTGAMLGTPAYASPEQLRGDEIDARSDIYAVGVTLYYLLTGRTPFSGDNMVRLLATVLERPAESPKKLRPEIPDELAAVILRCLAKQPAQRFRNYEELRLALLPFTSAAPIPAGIGMRLLAAFMDGTFTLALMMALLLAFFHSSLAGVKTGFPHGIIWLLAVPYLLPVLTFVLPEGLWGVTLGKAILGLRVIGLKRKSPGLLRALLRNAILFATAVIGSLAPIVVAMIVGNNGSKQNSLMHVAIFAPEIFLLLLFVTARRRNGRAAVHDLASGTRVVLKPNWQIRSAAAPTPEAEAIPRGTREVGPYHVLADLGRSDSSELFIGFDTRLFRRVWIREVPENAAEISPTLRMLTRQGRLRWLGGKRAAGENWDAYEALTGKPLTSLLDKPQPWKQVRFWLADLAAELETAVKDQTLPAKLGLDRVWITDDGRAKLLDFPAPVPAGSITDNRTGTAATINAAPPLPLTDHDAQLFLKRVAVAALEGRSISGTDLKGYAPQIPMPLHARSLVTRIGQFPAFDGLLAELGRIRNMPAEISARRRLVLLAGCVLPALMIGLVGAITLGFITTYMGGTGKTSTELRDFTELAFSMDKLALLQKDHRTDGIDQALETYIAGRFNSLVTNPLAWHNESYRNILTPDQRQAAEKIIASRAPVSAKDFNDASARVKPLGVGMNLSDKLGARFTFGKAAIMVMSMWAMYTGIPALIAALLFRGGLLLHGLGLAIVTRNGAPARRWRVLLRAAIVWLPAILVPTLLLSSPLGNGVRSALVIGAACFYFGAALASLRTPDAGLQDSIARTRMVPR